MATEDVSAERMVLGAAVVARGESRDTAHAAVLSLEASDFTDTRNRVIHAVLREMITKGVPIDSKTVCAELEARGKLNTPGGAGGTLYVFDLAQHVTVDAAPYYAEIVRTTTRLRMLRDIAADTAATCELEDASAHVDTLIGDYQAKVDGIPGPVGAEDDHANDYLGAILADRVKPKRWIIPGLLTRQERVVFVAPEGWVKSTLLRQFAVCIAMGLNPWNGQRVTDGKRVLFIDAENTRDQTIEAYPWIVKRCRRPLSAPGFEGRILHKTRGDGVDLPGADAKWLMDLAAHHSPDVLILGPAYKLMAGDPKDDKDTIALLNIIDKVRIQHDCAVLIETHAGHGPRGAREMRPFGSSLWLRWPEIGLGFQRDESEHLEQQARPANLEAVEWRGSRQERDWPDLIEHGDPRNQPPWVPTRGDWAPSIDLAYQATDVKGVA